MPYVSPCTLQAISATSLHEHIDLSHASFATILSIPCETLLSDKQKLNVIFFKRRPQRASKKSQFSSCDGCGSLQ